MLNGKIKYDCVRCVEFLSRAARHQDQTSLLPAAAGDVSPGAGIFSPRDLSGAGGETDQLAAGSQGGRVLSGAAGLGVGALGVVRL